MTSKISAIKFIVVGTGRCGTGYVSQAFKALGVPCGHEEIFTPYGVMANDDLVADSSWLAVPYLAGLDTIVIHLKRNPLSILNSLLAAEELWTAENAWGKWIHDRLPILNSLRTPEAKITTFFVEWVDRISPHVCLDWRIETLETADLASLAFEIGYDYDELFLDQVEKVPRNYNTRPKTIRGWDFWLQHPHGHQVRDISLEWGY